MGRVLTVVFLLLLAAVGVCFYMGWFQLSFAGDRWNFSVHFTADKEKIEEGGQKAKKELEKAGQKAKKELDKVKNTAE